jgi:hypothetical protein
MYVFVCICMYYVNVCMFTRMYECMYIHSYACVRTLCVYVYIRACMNVCICMCMYGRNKQTYRLDIKAERRGEQCSMRSPFITLGVSTVRKTRALMIANITTRILRAVLPFKCCAICCVGSPCVLLHLKTILHGCPCFLSVSFIQFLVSLYFINTLAMLCSLPVESRGCTRDAWVNSYCCSDLTVH